MFGNPGVTRPVAPTLKRDCKAPGHWDESAAGGSDESPVRLPPASVGARLGAAGVADGNGAVAVGKRFGVGMGAPRLQATDESARNDTEIVMQSCFMDSVSQEMLYFARSTRLRYSADRLICPAKETSILIFCGEGSI